MTQTTTLVALLGAFALLMLGPVTAASAQTGDNYRLDAGDEIVINVFGEDDLSMDFSLNDSGVLNYPFLGELQIAGLSVAEVERLITGGLKGPYLVNPDVSVSIKQYRPFFLNGEVQKPGGYAYQPGLTVEKAIALAGGFTERASKSKITVNRAGESARINLEAPVLPDDIITVQQSFF